MASRVSSPSLLHEPMSLIENTDDGSLQVNEDALKELKKLAKPCVVVAIAGLYRTGKSYLMNRLAGHTDCSQRFVLGSTTTSVTKGIWWLALEHPLNPDQYLVLLDTEGLGDAKKGDLHNDNLIFCLTALMSSMLVYNAKGPIDEDLLNKLNFITEMSKHIKTREKDEGVDDEDFDMFFPHFAFALRDFTLEIPDDATPYEYMMECLKVKKGDDERTKKFNLPRLCIQKYFKKLFCFTFDVPAKRKMLPKLDTLSDEKLSEEFVEEMGKFCKFVYEQAPVKKLDNGKSLNGNMLAVMATTYVDAIRNGSVPCIENAVTSMAKLENGRAMDEGLSIYTDAMSKNVKMPTADNKSMDETHLAAVKEALDHFLKIAVLDDGLVFQKKLNMSIEKKFEVLKEENAKVSETKCRETLDSLKADMDMKAKSGAYAKAGGFAEYQNDSNHLHQAYNAREGLGVKKQDVLSEFLEENRKEGQHILAADKMITEEAKKAEAAKMEAEKRGREIEEAQRQIESQRENHERMERVMRENQERAERKAQEESAMREAHQREIQMERDKLNSTLEHMQLTVAELRERGEDDRRRFEHERNRHDAEEKKRRDEERKREREEMGRQMKAFQETTELKAELQQARWRSSHQSSSDDSCNVM